MIGNRVTCHALLIHGLNNRPEAMASAAAELLRIGVTSTVAHLTGHWEQDPIERFQRFKEACPEIWLEDVERAYRQALQESCATDRDLILVGYSLGSLLGLLLAQSGRACFSRQILLAPAIGLHSWSFLPRLAGPWNFPVPSVMPQSLRANAATPVSAYKSLFALLERFEPHQPTSPSLVMMRSADELVSFPKVRAWTQGGPQRELVRLRPTVRRGHLIIDKEHAGALNWRTMWLAAADFLKGAPATEKRR